MTPAALLPEVVRLLAVQLAAFLALLLMASGVHKYIRRDQTQAVVHEFAGVPRYLAPFAVLVVASLEVLASLLLWTPSYRAAGAALAVLICGGYLSLILRAIAQGRREVDCGCTFGVTRRPLGLFQAARNGALTCAALLVAAVSAAGASGPVIGSQILAAFALLALYGALDQVMALTPPRSADMP
jgi:hypothetical protein